MTEININEEQFKKLVYSTYGSYGQFYNNIAILKDGRVINAKNYIWVKRYFKESDDIIIFETNSRKNYHIKVYINKNLIVAILKEEKSSSRWYPFQVIEGSGEVIVETTKEEKIEDNKKVTYYYNEYIYKNDEFNIKALLKKELIKRETELIGKPKIKVIKNGDNFYIIGDTYYIKEKLKELGAKWNGEYWISNDINIIEKLKEIADIIEEQKPDLI